jgi:hypothetical protein
MQPIIKHERVRFEAAEPRAPLPGAQGPATARAQAPVARAQPALRLARVQGEVRAIELSCGCGAQHLIELEYEARDAARNEETDA